MAKMIRVTPELREELVAEFTEYVSKNLMTDGKLNFTKDYSKVDRKATVFFKPLAWFKMQALVAGCDKEIAWRGIAKRLEGDDYLIEDILCYPQLVTSVTVTTDDEEECNWFSNLTDDQLLNLRLQGHSHVNMGVSPSATDLSFYNDVIKTLGDDDFYIFQIWNKKGDRTCKIYDCAKNIMFDTTDCSVQILLEDFNLAAWQKESLEMLKENKPATTKVTTPVYKKEEVKTESKADGDTKKKKGKQKQINSSYTKWWEEEDDDDDYYYGSRKKSYGGYSYGGYYDF